MRYSPYIRTVLLLPVILAPGPVLKAGAAEPDSIFREDPSITAWAESCDLVRGPGIIYYPDSVEVTHGEASMATGAADGRVVSLGDGGAATLGFSRPFGDHPGPDLAVFENSFDGRFLELAFVEVSSDGLHFIRFPASSGTPTDRQVESYGTMDHRLLRNLAGKYPSDWGTAFDLGELRDSAGLDPGNVRWIRVVDVIGVLDDSLGSHDAFGTLVNDPFPTAFANGGFDLDAVGVLGYPAGLGGVPVNRISLYPNPCRDHLVLGSPDGGNWVLCGPDGKIVAAGRAVPGENRLDVRELSAGFYILNITAAGYSASLGFCKSAQPFRP